MKREALRAGLAQLAARHLQRRRRTVTAIESDAGPAVVVDGRRLINFCGNDYLGLNSHPALTTALTRSAAIAGAGSGASHLITGHGLEHERLEAELAQFTGRARALLFSTGYMANLAAITCLAERDGRVVMDRLCHASLIDAARLSGAQLKRFAHADYVAAGVMFERGGTGADLLVSDGVFSMDGDLAPLPQLAQLAAANAACLIVDDAHGLGVMGPTGRGTLEHFQLDSAAVPILVGTLGKAFGCFGAFVAGDEDYIEWLLQTARSYIYTTALPQPVAAAARAALQVAVSEGWRRERVLQLAARLRRGATDAGITLLPSISPIQPVVLGSSARTLAVSEQLFAAGFWVAAIREPTVPKGSARLRITLCAAHSEAQVDALIEALVRALRDTSDAAA
ncbi:MAG TPA: 8-amino-7-oxononanoate synthase [Steroidobacteraceae bacterium]|jgi:8-amino-7-oxononanoate synthase|nr:8-amino-7-oxononanoate synthase [Steroidobacteraceae bacterium]